MNWPSLSVWTLKRVSPVSELPVPVKAGATVAPATGLPSGSTTRPVILTALLERDRHGLHAGRQVEVDVGRNCAASRHASLRI